MYSEIVKKHFENSINLGIIENEICSDIIKIYIKVDKKVKG